MEGTELMTNAFVVVCKKTILRKNIAATAAIAQTIIKKETMNEKNNFNLNFQLG